MRVVKSPLCCLQGFTFFFTPYDVIDEHMAEVHDITDANMARWMVKVNNNLFGGKP
ncbi:MAG: hypothetical protein M3Y53_03935 [Thermoproteota archaeon]|nr:hypothetical protein [Thermoproteota archaeon]